MMNVALIVIQIPLALMYVFLQDVMEVVHTSSLDACSGCLDDRGIYMVFKHIHNGMASYSVNDRRSLHLSFLWAILHMQGLKISNLKTSIFNVLTQEGDNIIFFRLKTFSLLFL